MIAEDSPLGIISWDPVPGKPGYVQAGARKSIGDVAKLIDAELSKLGLDHEGFSTYPSVDQSLPFPEGRHLACFVASGSCEGHYVHIEVIGTADLPPHQGLPTRDCSLLYLCKTFGGAKAAWEIAQACFSLIGD